MGYRGWRYYHWAKKPSKYSKLVQMFGEVVEDIRSEFFNLPDDALNELFLDYKEVYGASAEAYCRKTYPKWKSRAVKLSGQTMERLIELVPPYLDANRRLRLLTILIERYKPKKPRYDLRVNVEKPHAGLSELESILTKLNVDDELANMPQKVMEAAQWLYNDDMTAARRMMQEILSAENNVLKAGASKEIELIKTLIARGQIETASYSLVLPSGQLFIAVYKPSFFSKLFGKD
jgi:hypothetical protein